MNHYQDRDVLFAIIDNWCQTIPTEGNYQS